MVRAVVSDQMLDGARVLHRQYVIIQSLHFIMATDNLSMFTSVLTLMAVKHPHLADELGALRSAVSQWYEGVEKLLLVKNRQLMAARTRGNQKLWVVFNEVQNFFHNLLRSYNDPNLPIYFNKFMKIKEEFDFADIDLSKFKEQGRTCSTQTDTQNSGIYGIDMDTLFKSFENKQNELDQAANKIQCLAAQNKQLEHRVARLLDKLRSDEQFYSNKIGELSSELQKSKQQAQELKSTQKKGPAFRSSPEINHFESFSNRKLVVNLLQNDFDDSFQPRQPFETSMDELSSALDPHLSRMLYCQATAIEALLGNIHEHMAQY